MELLQSCIMSLVYFEGLMQKKRNSSALAMELNSLLYWAIDVMSVGIQSNQSSHDTFV